MQTNIAWAITNHCVSFAEKYRLIIRRVYILLLAIPSPRWSPHIELTLLLDIHVHQTLAANFTTKMASGLILYS